jgi:hypothetical protein
MITGMDTLANQSLNELLALVDSEGFYWLIVTTWWLWCFAVMLWLMYPVPQTIAI